MDLWLYFKLDLVRVDFTAKLGKPTQAAEVPKKTFNTQHSHLRETLRRAGNISTLKY